MGFIFLPIILLAAGILRFYNNTALALWHDEAFSALYLRYDWGEMMYRIGLDVHPPLYYILLRFWTYATGDSLLALRAFSILFGVLTIWAAYKFVSAAFGSRKLALLAALFLGINPFQIQYALEARMYTLGTFLALFSSYLLVRAFENSPRTFAPDTMREKKHSVNVLKWPKVRGRKYWLWYGLAAAAALYTHYYLAFTIAAQGLFILLYIIKSRNLKILWRSAGAYLLALILYLPWLKTFLRQISQVQESYWIPPIAAWSVPGTIWKMAFGGPGIRNLVLVLTSIIALLILIKFVRHVKNFQKWHVAFAVIIPFIAAVGLSLRTNLYLDRYFVFAALYFIILVVLALYQAPTRIWRWSLLILLAIASIYAFFGNWQKLDVRNKPGMAEAARYLNSNTAANDNIYVGSSFVYFTFKYYNKTGVAPLLYSPGKLESIPHFSGTAILTDADLVSDFNLAPNDSNVFLLWTTGFGGSRPEVPQNWQQLEQKSYEDTPGFKGQIFVTKYLVKQKK
ncbi:MAG: glycosyltransferase family 39 protein [bacterium]|nr:glycosyltransferase family 39 protein [bacterium]